MQYSNTDDSQRPQKLHIEWSLLTPRDYDGTPPDERQDGFWPSLDPDAPGYIGSDSKADYQKQLRTARGIMSSWKADSWWYVGVVARAVVYIPVGGNSFRLMTIESAGLWGIESSAKSYIKTVYAEAKAELMAELMTLAGALQSGAIVHKESE